MTVKTTTSPTWKTSMTRNLTCTAAIAAAALLPLALPTAASALSVGQMAANGVSFSARGQSFSPSVIGSGGSGTPPTSGNVTLNSFTFAYNGGVDRTASTLYIYSSVPTLANLNNAGAGALYSSTSASDSSDTRFGGWAVPIRTFSFTGAVLDVNTTYFALFAQNQAIRTEPSDTTAYAGGALYVPNPNTSSLVTSPFGDAAFVAEFTPVPVPFAFNPLFGLGTAGLLKAGRALRDRLRDQKSSSTLS